MPTKSRFTFFFNTEFIGIHSVIFLFFKILSSYNYISFFKNSLFQFVIAHNFIKYCKEFYLNSLLVMNA